MRTIILRLPDRDYNLFHISARADGRSLNQWLHRAGLKASGASLEDGESVLFTKRGKDGRFKKKGG